MTNRVSSPSRRETQTFPNPPSHTSCQLETHLLPGNTGDISALRCRPLPTPRWHSSPKIALRSSSGGDFLTCASKVTLVAFGDASKHCQRIKYPHQRQTNTDVMTARGGGGGAMMETTASGANESSRHFHIKLEL